MSINRAFHGRVRRYCRIFSAVAFLAMLCILVVAAQDKASVEPKIRAEGAFAALVVTDLEASLQWYESNLNMRVIKRGRSPRVAATTVVLGGHNFFVELIHYDSPAPLKPPQDDRQALENGVVKVGMILNQPDFDSLWKYLHNRAVNFVGDGSIFSDKEMEVR